MKTYHVWYQIKGNQKSNANLWIKKHSKLNEVIQRSFKVMEVQIGFKFVRKSISNAKHVMISTKLG